MRNVISEDDIEQAILQKLAAELFEYGNLHCDASPERRESLLTHLMSGRLEV